MSGIRIMKAVEFDKLASAFRKRYKNEQALVAAGWWTQKKYDGCFGMAVVRRLGGESVMLSRTGEDYTPSCGHILDELRDAANERCSSWAEFVVLGEVWHPALPFPTISGKFRKRAPSELQFVAHDLLPIGLQSDDPYRLRFADLCELLPLEDDTKVYVAETFQMTMGNVQGLARAWKESGGFDGAILRDPDAGYTVGLVKNGQIVKVKPTLSLDLRVIDAKTEPGAKTGRDVLTLCVEYRGVASWVGSGVPHDMLVGDACGQIVEVECMGITEDGKLREPRFKGVRFDKEQADT